MDGLGDLVVGRDPLDRLGFLQLVEQPLAGPGVVVLEVDHRHPGIAPIQAMLRAVAIDQVALDDPVQLTAQRHRVLLEPVEHVLPADQDVLGHRVQLAGPVIAVRQLEELPLDGDGGDGPVVAEPDRHPAGQVA